MFLLRLFGTVSIEGPDGVVTGKGARRHALALLALLALSRNRRLSREKLIGYLWPESDSSDARNLLNQSVHALRRALGLQAILSEGDELALNPAFLECDVWSFERAQDSDEPQRVVDLYAGPFADGFGLTDSVEFERWVDAERARLRQGYLTALQELADWAGARGDSNGAAEWWRRLSAEDPYNSTVTLRLMQTLESAGHRGGAIREAEGHADRMRQDLDATPDPEVMALAERMRTQPSHPASGSASAGRRDHPTERGTAGGRMIREVHRRSLWQVGLVYIGGLWACSAIIDTISERLALPTWVATIALILLLLGLPIVLVTAFVQGGGPFRGQVDPQPISDRPEPPEDRTGHWLTWRKAVAGGVSAFSLLGIASAGYVAMRAFGIGPLATLMTRGIVEERDVIVLADFEDHAGDATVALAVTEALRVDLAQSRVVRVVEPDYVSVILGQMERDRDTGLTYDIAREVAIRGGFKAVVTGGVSGVGSGYVLSARLVAAETGEELYSVRETAREPDAVIPSIDRLSRRLRTNIGEPLRAIRDTPPLSQARTASLEALRLQTEALRAANRGEHHRALELLDGAIEIDTLFAEAYRARVSALGNLGINRTQRVADAARAYELRHRFPLWERYWFEAEYHASRGDSEREIEAYRRLLELKSHPQALNNLGLAYEHVRKYAQAEECFHRRLAMNPLAGSSWVDLARVQFNQGKFEEADQTLERFESKLPNHSWIPQYRALFASARGDYASAEGYLRIWADPDQPDPARQGSSDRYLAHLAQLQGRLSQAEERYLDAMRSYDEGGLDDKYLDTGIELAHMRVRLLGDTARALETVAAALARHPLDRIGSLDRPYLPLALFYSHTGDVDRSRQLLVERDAVVPPDFRKHPLEAVERRVVLAALALSEGSADAAVAEYRSALEHDWYPVWRYPMLARAYELAAQPDSAVALYERYLSTPFYGRALSGFYISFGTDRDWLPVAYEHLGNLYEQRADSARASHYYGKLIELWEGADPELQPRVAAARRAVAALSPNRY